MQEFFLKIQVMSLMWDANISLKYRRAKKVFLTCCQHTSTHLLLMSYGQLKSLFFCHKIIITL